MLSYTLLGQKYEVCPEESEDKSKGFLLPGAPSSITGEHQLSTLQLRLGPVLHVGPPLCTDCPIKEEGDEKSLKKSTRGFVSTVAILGHFTHSQSDCCFVRRESVLSASADVILFFMMSTFTFKVKFKDTTNKRVQ